MGRKLRITIGVVCTAVAAVYVGNASWRVSPSPEARTEVIAHRGIHQTFGRDDLDSETCSATRMDTPRHGYLENTIASMRAAFDAGADIVELDVHPTTDGHFAVFHDWTLDCRTNGSGRTRDHDLAYLKSLDIGHGYTTDGETYPFRSKGVGAMPELREVLAAFPDRRLLVNFKSREAREGDMLTTLLNDNPQWRTAVWGVYGGDEPTLAAKSGVPALQAWTRTGLKDCLLGYLGLGWSGHVPAACRDTVVMVPLNLAPFVWGWPHLFTQRMQQAGSRVILVGPFHRGDPDVAGIDTAEQLARVPQEFDGFIWTNRVEDIAPLVRQRLTR